MYCTSMYLLLFFVGHLLVVHGIPTSSDSHNEFTIYRAIEQTLLNTSTGPGELFRLRNAFFPSSSEKYQFWRADGLQTLQFNACLNITNILCRNAKDSQGVFAVNTTFTACWAYQWTNSYLLSLLGTQQLYQFEPLLTSLIYSQTVGHREINFHVTLNITDPILCSIKEKDLEKYFTSFITWTKAYAAAEGKPKTWSEDDQGYVSRKYNTYSKGLYYTDLQNTINYLVLACFVSGNLLVTFLLVMYGSWLYNKVCSVTRNKPHTMKSDACKGLLSIMPFLLVPIYLVGLFVGHANGVYPKYYPPCNRTVFYNCTPPHSSIVYILEVASFYTKVAILVAVLPAYFVSARYSVWRSDSQPHPVPPYILFRHQSICFIIMDTYVWWSTLAGIHIFLGLAGVPILMFLIITPTYTIFFVFGLAVVIVFLTLPVILLFQHCHPNRNSTLSKFKLCKIWSSRFVIALIGYLLGVSLTVSLIYLYYGLLLGGASMNGTKGILFSLIPPAIVTASGFFVKYRYFRQNSNNKAVDHQSTNNVVNNTETA